MKKKDEKKDAGAKPDQQTDKKKEAAKNGQAEAAVPARKPRRVIGNIIRNLNEVNIGGVGAIAIAGNDNEAMAKQMEAQFEQQYRGYLNSELTLVRQMVNLPIDKRKLVKEAGEKALKSIAKEQASRRNQGQPVPMSGPQLESPESRIRDAIAKSLEEILPEDQRKTFQEENRHRVEHRKRAAINLVVSQLDGVLFLSDDQRSEIIQSIETNWKAEWENWLMLSAYGGQYFPMNSDELIVKSLNSNQKTIWQTTQKIQLQWFDQFGDAGEIDAWWNEEESK